VEVAARLKSQVRGADTLARLGGDEFVLLCPGISDETTADDFAGRLAVTLGRPIDLGGVSVSPTCSIGFALGEGGDVDTDELLQRADIAMHKAKDRGPGHMERGTRQMLDEELERRALREQIERAVEEQQFSLRYQPIVDVRTGGIEAVEALIRWEDPERGTVLPGDFLPLAEATGLIVPMGQWAFAEASRQAAQWNAEHMDRAPIRMYVNASAREFAEPGFVTGVVNAARGAGIDIGQLTVEVTESMMMQNEALGEVAFDLASAGAQVALDDFGAAYSSLGRLAAMPLDIVKIVR
jgi:predicted signal transduction protein with EAL and GGDEF domain